jgi:uncharacterized protein YjbI with pentapeptide repeats
VKVIKPQKLALLTRTFELKREFFLSASVILFVPLEDPRNLLPEIALWKFLPGELGRDAALDASMPKSRAEFLVTGRAFPLGGKPAAACSPRVQIGPLDKSLLVVGDRLWKHGAPTIPEPFTEMPISWENAFGGPDFKLNPLGKGAAPITRDGNKLHPLPNVEDPKRRIGSPADRPAPAGFGPYDFTWPQRAKKVGTYDKKWLKDHFPGLAPDIDWTLFNAAPDDQQMDAFFRGDEAFTLEFLHPERSRIEGRLPGAVARCFINVKTPEGERFQEVGTKLDTVWFFPHAARAVLVFHGSIKVAEDDASDVLQIVAACEEKGAPKPVEHYQQALAARLDRTNGVLAGLRDGELLPPWSGTAAGVVHEDMQAIVSENLLAKNARKRMVRELEQNRAELAAQGVDPSFLAFPALPPEPGTATLEDDLSRIEKLKVESEAQMKALEQERAVQEEQVRQALTAQGLDPEPFIESLRNPPGGPPQISAAEELQKLQATADQLTADGQDASPILAMLADPEFRKRLEEGEAKLRESYRGSAHLMNPALSPAPDEAMELRAKILAGLAAGESFDARDLTGADLSGLSLTGAKLSGAFLEGAKLAGADLTGADLSRAILARADLTGAKLSKANLTGVNLGGATLREVQAIEASFQEAVFYKADLAGANLHGAQLGKANLIEARCAEADFSGVQASQLFFYKTDLSRLRLVGANLRRSVFLEARLEGTDFSEACLESAVFVAAQGRGARFCRARAKGLRMVQACAFEEADFCDADLERANLRGSQLGGAKLTRARLASADLSECNLKQANLDCAYAREVRLDKSDLTDATALGADLMAASLRKGDIRGMDLRAASLFQADFARVHSDERVKLAGANLNKARVEPKRDR